VIHRSAGGKEELGYHELIPEVLALARRELSENRVFSAAIDGGAPACAG